MLEVNAKVNPPSAEQNAKEYTEMFEF